MDDGISVVVNFEHIAIIYEELCCLAVRVDDSELEGVVVDD